MPDSEKAVVPFQTGQVVLGGALDSSFLQGFVADSLAAAHQESSGQRCTVLFGDWDDLFIDHFEQVLHQQGGEASITVTRCGEIAELHDAMSRRSYDLAVITLNNVFGCGESPDDRVRAMLDLVRRVKDSTAMPVIAISGHYDSDDLPERATAAGADIFRDRDDTDDLATLAVLYLSRAHPELKWTTDPGN